MLYELTLILKPDLTAKAVEENLDKIKKFIEGQIGGKVQKSSTPELKGLAYPIRKPNEKFNKGFFATLCFDSQNPQKFENLREQLRLDKALLRYLLLKTEKVAEEKKAPIKRTIKRKPAEIKKSLPKIDTQKILPPDEKAKLEEIDKKLEEILNE